MSICEDVPGVREGRGLPAVKNRSGTTISPARSLRENPVRAGLGVTGKGLDVLRGVKVKPRRWFAGVGVWWCGVAAVEQRLCSGGRTGRERWGCGGSYGVALWVRRRVRGHQIKETGDLGEVCPGEVPAEIAGGRCAAGEGGEEGGG